MVASRVPELIQLRATGATDFFRVENSKMLTSDPGFCGFVRLVCSLGVLSVPLGVCSWAPGYKGLSFTFEAPAQCPVESGLKQI